VELRFELSKIPDIDNVVRLYRSVDWPFGEESEKVRVSLANCHEIASAWDGDKLVGLALAVSDGAFVVYYSHVMVDPDYQGYGVGAQLMEELGRRYKGFHQEVVLCDRPMEDFYVKCGFTPLRDIEGAPEITALVRIREVR